MMANVGSGDGLECVSSNDQQDEMPSACGSGRGRGRGRRVASPHNTQDRDHELSNPGGMRVEPTADDSSGAKLEAAPDEDIGLDVEARGHNVVVKNLINGPVLNSGQLRQPRKTTIDKLKSPRPLAQLKTEADGDKNTDSQEEASKTEYRLNVDAAEFVPTNLQQSFESEAKSTLNVSAAEFIPRNGETVYSASDDSKHVPDDEMRALASNYERLTTTVPDLLIEPSSGAYPEAVDRVKEAVFSLTVNPGNLDDYLIPLATELNDLMKSEETLKQIIDIIFEQAITEPNFTYTGARMCNYLSEKLQNINNKSFRDSLLTRIHKEHMEKEELVVSDNERVCGFTMFLAEVFLHLKVQGEHIVILGQALQDILDILLLYTCDGNNNLRCVVNVLKCTGAILEDSVTRANSSLDPLFQKIHEAVYGDKYTSNQKLKDMLQQVLTLRLSNWGRSESSVLSNGFINNKHLSAPPFTQLDPVFYDTEGKQITREQAGYDESYDYDETTPEDPDYISEADLIFYDNGSEIDDEIDEAYEQFLREIESGITHIPS
ncbi:polyadenylate-binding protein-interacting protein 1-like isoform X2 [Tubulanus polymorphus]|uniref:polyadenylate-binding protein-interacting protein 1-like isoform X2 n=1 Tax=Tubulanus polymorphus TaxID=672921 RepID=UPI003DA25DB9